MRVKKIERDLQNSTFIKMNWEIYELGTQLI